MSRHDEHTENTHQSWMQLALELAERGRGFVEPNPLVGAVVVREGTLVGQGWHQKFGEAHAEVNALREAGDAAKGATLYVTLEPCCHHGKTPPCVDAVIRSGVQRVVAATGDPFPEVAGDGFAALRAQGIEVIEGVCETEAKRQNAPFIKFITTGKPYVHAKWAMTLDGKIATRTGDSMWISNEHSRSLVHELRGRMDAILVGIGTVLADDPKLSARPAGPRVATRIALDPRAETSLDRQLVRTARDIPTMIAVGDDVDDTTLSPLRDAGCEIVVLPLHGGRLSPEDLLLRMGERRWTNVLVEGGAGVFGSFLDADAIDEFHVFVAPKLIGGRTSLSAVGGIGRDKMADALALTRTEISECGGDVYIRGWKGDQG